MDKFLIHNFLPYIDPFATEDDLVRAEQLNEYEILFEFKNGRKCVYDTMMHGFRGFYPEGYELTDEEWKSSFRVRLHKLMKHRQITQEELAAAVGTSQVMISRYITGQCVPGVVMLAKISRALHCSMDDLIYQDL
jgi:DNA-binding Xre family transcriptional regulator